jgi:predicted nucleic acid-binding protein
MVYFNLVRYKLALIVKSFMPLTTTNNYSNNFLSKKRLLLDSCVLIDLATDQRTKNILNQANAHYSFVYCVVSMLEVGFGPIEKVDKRQDELARKIYLNHDVIAVDNRELLKRERDLIEDPPRAVFSYNPNWHEWYAARHNLIEVMEVRGIGGRRARDLSNDAIIFSSAWNSGSALITSNVSDFDLFNKVLMNKNPKHMLPVFTIDNLELSFSSEVSFPENIR